MPSPSRCEKLTPAGATESLADSRDRRRATSVLADSLDRLRAEVVKVVPSTRVRTHARGVVRSGLKWTTCALSRGSPGGVTFVTFPRGICASQRGAGVTFGWAAVTFAGDRAVPGAGEALVPRPLAQPVRGLAAHPDGRRRAADAAGLVQRHDELDLPVDGPAVPSTSLRTGAADAGG